MECCDQPNIGAFEKANPSLLGCLNSTLPLSYCLTSTQCSTLQTRSIAHFAGSLKTRLPGAVLLLLDKVISGFIHTLFSPCIEGIYICVDVNYAAHLGFLFHVPALQISVLVPLSVPTTN